MIYINKGMLLATLSHERERLLGIAKKLMNLLVIPSSLSRSYWTFPLTLIEIDVY
jgi:hypothetical protein